MAKPAPPPEPVKPPASEEPDDYMSMNIIEPTQPPQKETYTQRRIRKQREAEQKSRPVDPSVTLSTALPSTSKGFQMLSKLGYTAGSTLGAPSNKNGMLEPVAVEQKEDRGGIGLANEKKRKFREELEGREREEMAEEGGFRERVARQREEKRAEGLVGGAMRVLEGLEEDEGGEHTDGARQPRKKKRVNVLYRGLVRQRREQERDRRARYDLHQSLSKNASYEDDEQDRLAWGGEEEDLDEEDEELDAFEKLEPRERLDRLVAELRARWWYCFWCKCRYADESLEGCPGTLEDDHD